VLAAVHLALPTVLLTGAIVGSVFSIMAMGIVAIYKATRVPNFAFGATATFIALFHYQFVAGHSVGLNLDWWFLHLHLHQYLQLSFWEMVPISLALAGLVGWLTERVVMRPFADAPTITLVIVSLGLMIALQGLAGSLFGIEDRFVTNAEAPFSRSHTIHVLGLYLTHERLGILAISLILAGSIFWFFARTRTGLAIRALASKRDVAQLCGVSATRLAVLSWVAGTVLAGIIGILLSAQQVTLNTTNLTLTSVVGFAAAVIGGMSSLPIAFAAGIGIGMLQELVTAYFPPMGIHLLGHTFTQTGMPEAVSVLAVLAILVARPSWVFRATREEEDSGVVARGGASSAISRALDPVQAWRSWRSALGLGWSSSRTRRSKTRWVLGVLAVVVALGWPILGLNHDVYGYDATIGLVYLMLCLSVVVITGWVGQISLAQGAFIAVGGVGTLIASNSLHLPFPLTIVFAAIFSVPFSLLIGIPALRLRGLYLAIATLAFGYGAARLVIGNLDLGTTTKPPLGLFGWRADTDLGRYYLLLGVALVVVLLCWRVSRTRPGRAFYAVRDSQTVAVAYGVDVVRTKLIGFVLAGAVASVGGSILVYMLGQPGNSYIDVFFSTTWLANSVVMGITVMTGAFLAAGTFGLLPLLLAGPTTAAGSGPSAEIVAGIATVLIMMINPGGVATMTRFVRRQATVHGGDDRAPSPGEPSIAAQPPEVAPDAGELTGASLRWGGSEPRRPKTREARLPEGAEP
jgi:branched-chain amino acid transport system permease protein